MSFIVFSQSMLGRIYLSAFANKYYSSKWSISRNPDQRWTNAVTTHDYSSLFETISDCLPRRISTIRTIRTFCYSRLFSISLFGFSRHPNKLILFEGLVEGFVPKICFFGQLKTCLKFPVGGLINTLREIRRKYIWNKLKWNSWARLLWELFDEYTAFPVFHLPWSK